jgi:hypothetical protein
MSFFEVVSLNPLILYILKFLNNNKEESSKTSLSPSLGKGTVRLYLGGRADSGKLYRHTGWK